MTGLTIQATAAGTRIGELVTITRAGSPLQAEVVGLRDELVTLLPLGDTTGIGPESEVQASGEPLAIRVSEKLLGRTLDGLGRVIDGDPPPEGSETWPVLRDAPHPLKRRRIDRVLPLGIKAIDGLLTLGEGQRIGLFAGPGVGKSSLIGQAAQQCDADVNVICLVGERGREVRAFIEDSLGEVGRARSVLVVATSDSPPLVRMKSAHVATAIAEWFRERGARVLLIMDSLTRFARAQRMVGLAAGELPARQGYPPSVFAALPPLLERAGNSERGTMTAIYTVLVPADDLRDPIADEVRGLLDGHVVLDRRLAERGQWPAVNVLRSLSRVMSRVVSPEHLQAAQRFRRILNTYETKRELITLGGYLRGSDPELDDAIARFSELEAYLKQPLDKAMSFDDTVAQLLDVAW